DSVATRAKVVRIEHRTGGAIERDVALIDAVAVDDPYVGSLELFVPETMRAALLTRADPSSIGFSSIGGLLEPVAADDPDGLYLRFATEDADAQYWVHAPTAPGHHSWIGIAEVRRVTCGEVIEIPGPLLLAFDGERKRRLRVGEVAALHVERDGPIVIDVRAVMAHAAATGLFVRTGV
ncbi:MAG: hypothetical protein HKN26_07890, partial [Acidimicrobiales bacterium]|nr:hypothetical protein [Acidimicrobiales bacterium]